VGWFKSSRSVSNGNCVEIKFRTSSRSSGGECVEVAACVHEVLVRDSKDRGGPVLRFTPAEWKAFVDGARDGEFDL